MTENVDPATDRAWVEQHPPPWGSSIDWADFWAADDPGAAWLLEPIVPAGRAVAIFSKAKEGKSLLALDITAAAATGRSVLGQPPRDPIHVLYADFEMTRDDLRERLTDLGYGPDDDWSHLHYYQLPAWPALDGKDGGEILAGAARECEAQLVVIDTMARVVSGGENETDTYRAFYRFTGGLLKADGRSLLRLDHEGKKGEDQRGSSAKNDDVDVVFRLATLPGNIVKLTRTHTRVPWVPAVVTIVRNDAPLLRHVWTDDAVPAGTYDCIRALDELDVPPNIGADAAIKILRPAGRSAHKTVVLAAQRKRRERAA